jgi:uroporphyrinogen decarboxylase
VTLLAEPKALEARAVAVLKSAAGRPGHIFNLGHGVLPQTSPDNVRRLVDLVHEWSVGSQGGADG